MTNENKLSKEQLEGLKEAEEERKRLCEAIKEKWKTKKKKK